MENDHDKLIRVDTELQNVSKTVLEIRDNHLAHLAADIKDIGTSVDKINTKLAMWSGGIIVAIWVLERFIK